MQIININASNSALINTVWTNLLLLLLVLLTVSLKQITQTSNKPIETIIQINKVITNSPL